MKKLIFLAVLAFAAWYGWKHYGSLKDGPASQVVIENQSGREIDRVRVTVGGQTYVREAIADGASEAIPFRSATDGQFRLRWQYERTDYDREWSGGTVTAGPLPARHRLQVQGDGGVIWTSEGLPTTR
jgi:hypothetical protein